MLGTQFIMKILRCLDGRRPPRAGANYSLALVLSTTNCTTVKTKNHGPTDVLFTVLDEQGRGKGHLVLMYVPHRPEMSHLLLASGNLTTQI